MRKLSYAIAGLVVGGLIGFVVATGIAYVIFSLTQPPSEWTIPASMGCGLMFGIPIGAIVLGAVGYWLGAKSSKR